MSFIVLQIFFLNLKAQLQNYLLILLESYCESSRLLTASTLSLIFHKTPVMNKQIYLKKNVMGAMNERTLRI